MPAPVLIHVGYHKTATTWMQKRLFVPEHGYRQICGHREVDELVVRPHGLSFDPAPMRSLIGKAANALAADETPVISSEILSGHPFYGGRESDAYAERLRRIYPEARILISVRNQMRILPSVYMQYVSRGGTMTARTFFEGTKEFGYFGFSPNHFEYDRLVGHYQDLFGKANVLVISQEGLKSDAAGVLSRLAEFSGNTVFSSLSPEAQRPVGESDPEYTVAVLRRINHVQTSILNQAPMISVGKSRTLLYRAVSRLIYLPPIPTIFKGRKHVSDHVKARFSGYYAESNSRLASQCAFPLDLSGYDMRKG